MTRLSEQFSSKMRLRQDNFQTYVQDWDKTESLNTFSLETGTRQWLSSFSDDCSDEDEDRGGQGGDDDGGQGGDEFSVQLIAKLSKM